VGSYWRRLLDRPKALWPEKIGRPNAEEPLRTWMSVWRVSLPSVGLTISRGQLIAGLFLFTSASGLLPQVIRSFRNEEWYKGVFSTFNTSIIVWGAWVSACYLALSAVDRNRIRPLDIAV